MHKKIKLNAVAGGTKMQRFECNDGGSLRSVDVAVIVGAKVPGILTPYTLDRVHYNRLQGKNITYNI